MTRLLISSRPRWPRVLRTLLLICLALFIGLFWLPVPLRIGGFEVAAYSRVEPPGSVSPKQGPTYLTSTGFRGEKASELIVRTGNRSFRLIWIIGG